MNIEIIDSKKYDKYWNYFQLKYDRYYDRVFKSYKLEKTIEEKVKFEKIEKSLTKCVERYLDNLDVNTIKLQPIFTGIMDKITKEHTTLSEFINYKERIKYILANSWSTSGGGIRFI